MYANLNIVDSSSINNNNNNNNISNNNSNNKNNNLSSTITKIKIGKRRRKRNTNVKRFFEHDTRVVSDYQKNHKKLMMVTSNSQIQYVKQKFKPIKKKRFKQRQQQQQQIPAFLGTSQNNIGHYSFSEKKFPICCCHCAYSVTTTPIPAQSFHIHNKNQMNRILMESSVLQSNGSGGDSTKLVPTNIGGCFAGLAIPFNRYTEQLKHGQICETLQHFPYEMLTNCNPPICKKELRSVVSVRETHQVAEAQQEKNAKLREAFGISEYFVEGSSFDPDRKAKEDIAKSTALQQELQNQKDLEKEKNRKYALVRTPSKEKEITKSKAEPEKKKKKKKNRDGSSTPEKKKDKKKKSKKHKKERSKKKKSRKRKETESEDTSESESDSNDSSDSEKEVKKRKKSKKDKDSSQQALL